jgi:hypothetical protein
MRPIILGGDITTLTLLRKFRRDKHFEVFQKTGSKAGRGSQNKIAENLNQDIPQNIIEGNSFRI